MTERLLAPLTSLPPLFDVNAAVGDWPFRRLPCNTVERLLERMDRLGVRRAAVSRLENVFYKDCLAGNRELHALIAPHAGRFVPLYAVNPAFPGWQADLEPLRPRAGPRRRPWGPPALPRLSRIRARRRRGGALLERAAALDVPVVVSTRLEDERTHHWLCRVAPVPPDALGAAIATAPGARWVVCGLRAPQVRAVWRGLTAAGAAERARVLFDLSFVQGPIDECQLLADAVGVERLAFGTNLPLTIPESTALALAYADLPADAIARIGAGNAARYFGLDVGLDRPGA